MEWLIYLYHSAVAMAIYNQKEETGSRFQIYRNAEQNAENALILSSVLLQYRSFNWLKVRSKKSSLWLKYILAGSGTSEAWHEWVYLGGDIWAGVLSLVQLVPALQEFNYHGIAEVHQLKACHVCSAMHETLQIDVLETLLQWTKAKGKEEKKYSS